MNGSHVRNSWLIAALLSMAVAGIRAMEAQGYGVANSTPQIWRERSTGRSIRSTRPISANSKSRGASRPTISARAPNTSWKERR